MRTTSDMKFGSVVTAMENRVLITRAQLIFKVGFIWYDPLVHESFYWLYRQRTSTVCHGFNSRSRVTTSTRATTPASGLMSCLSKQMTSGGRQLATHPGIRPCALCHVVCYAAVTHPPSNGFFSFIYSLFYSIHPLSKIVELVMIFSYEYTPTTKTLLFRSA